MARPDLTVVKGAVHASAGRLSGSFVVHASGRAARPSAAALTVRVAKRMRVLGRFAVPALKRGGSRTVKVAGAVPTGLPAGTYALRACADRRDAVRERSESNNCRGVGTLKVAAPTGTPTPPIGPVEPGPVAPEPPAPAPTPPAPVSSVPTAPVAYTPDTAFTLTSTLSPYWVSVPTTYDPTGATPITLFVWLHGCGGEAAYDISTVSPAGARSYLSIAVGGREGGCWDVEHDTALVLAAIADVKTHFNVAPRRVVLGGYSSGGDLAYRTAFYDARQFAGVLAENTSPFRDTGSSPTASLAAAAWKFHVVHLAHRQDDTYPIAGVRTETDMLTAAGFPIQRIEADGGHYDDPGDIENGHAVPGTDSDLRTLLLPHLDDGWQAPADG